MGNEYNLRCPKCGNRSLYADKKNDDGTLEEDYIKADLYKAKEGKYNLKFKIISGDLYVYHYDKNKWKPAYYYDKPKDAAFFCKCGYHSLNYHHFIMED